MTISDVFSKSWATIRTQPGFWFKILAALFIPFFLYQATILFIAWNAQSTLLTGFTNGTPPSNFISTILWIYPIFVIVAWLFTIFTRAVVIEGASALSGNDTPRISLRQTIQRSLSKLSKILGIDLILIGPFAFIYFGIMFLMFRDMLPLFDALFSEEFFSAVNGLDPASGQADFPPGFPMADFPPPTFALIPLIVCGTFLLAPPLLVWTVFSSAATMLEDRGVIASIKRGIQIVWENLGTVLILLIVLVIGIAVISALLSMLTIPFTFMAMVPLQVTLLECASNELDIGPAMVFECIQPMLNSPMFLISQSATLLLSSISYVIQILLFLIPISVFFNGAANK